MIMDLIQSILVRATRIANNLHVDMILDCVAEFHNITFSPCSIPRFNK
jgi:hypothetical protein